MEEPQTSTEPRGLRRDLLEPGPGQDPRLRRAPVRILDSVDSTNEDLLRRLTPGTTDDAAAPPAAQPGPPAHLEALLSEHQSQGRGRRDRQWSAPPRTSVILSVLVRSEVEPGGGVGLPTASLHWLSLIMALSAAEAVERVTGLRPSLKWPNDLLLGQRKLAGILARVAPDPRGGYAVAVGLGLNVDLHREQLPVPTATSLSLSGAEQIDRTRLCAEIIAGFREAVDRFAAVDGDPARPWGDGPDLLTRLRARTDTLGRRVRVQRGEGLADLVGTAVDLDRDGGLVLREERIGRVSVSVGDVVHLRPAGADDEPAGGGRL